jgi:hypothetical protein
MVVFLLKEERQNEERQELVSLSFDSTTNVFKCTSIISLNPLYSGRNEAIETLGRQTSCKDEAQVKVKVKYELVARVDAAALSPVERVELQKGMEIAGQTSFCDK